jgi:hypothetical protein
MGAHIFKIQSGCCGPAATHPLFLIGQTSTSAQSANFTRLDPILGIGAICNFTRLARLPERLSIADRTSPIPNSFGLGVPIGYNRAIVFSP